MLSYWPVRKISTDLYDAVRSVADRGLKLIDAEWRGCHDHRHEATAASCTWTTPFGFYSGTVRLGKARSEHNPPVPVARSMASDVK
jgi:hypothetical protein